MKPNTTRDSLRSLWDNASELLRRDMITKKVKLLVTIPAWENYYNSYVNDECVEAAWYPYKDGSVVLYFRGLRLHTPNNIWKPNNYVSKNPDSRQNKLSNDQIIFCDTL